MANSEKYREAILPVIENVRAAGKTMFKGIVYELNRLGFKAEQVSSSIPLQYGIWYSSN